MADLARTFKVLYTHRSGKPAFINLRARDRQHALDILNVLSCEDAIVLFEAKQLVLKPKEARK